MPDQHHLNQSGFIPAKESKAFIKLFGWYTRLLFHRRFKQIWIKQNYQPDKNSKTVYYLNHSSWWDGLIPLLLNNYRFRQQARAMMEDKQMIRYPFFRRIGAFSVSPDNSRKSIHALRYALESMERPNSSLFIYPEGEIIPFSTEKPEFKEGIAWLYNKLPQVDFVPIGIYIHTIRHDKPELHLYIGEPVSGIPGTGSNHEIRLQLETALHRLLRDLKTNSGFEDTGYRKWL
jgi:1-acyl-sn-glycerol-3-phosphate acyltransferase